MTIYCEGTKQDTTLVKSYQSLTNVKVECLKSCDECSCKKKNDDSAIPRKQ